MHRWTIVCCLTLALGTAVSSQAHHSFAALFDTGRTVAVTGEVTQFEFKAPHSYIELVVEEGGEPVEWQIETATPGMLIRRGITPDTLRAGHTISVTGNPTRDGRNLMRLLTITMADGTELQLQ